MEKILKLAFSYSLMPLLFSILLNEINAIFKLATLDDLGDVSNLNND